MRQSQANLSRNSPFSSGQAFCLKKNDKKGQQQQQKGVVINPVPPHRSRRPQPYPTHNASAHPIDSEPLYFAHLLWDVQTCTLI